jgi:hypothetical protein
MRLRQSSLRAARWPAIGIGAGLGAYALYVAAAWIRYGHARPAGPRALTRLDEFMPTYDVRERHQVLVNAPAGLTLDAALDLDLFHLPPIRAIFRAREWLLGSLPDDRVRPRGLAAEALSLGWGQLANLPGREVIFGAVTRPWEANVTFRAVSADRFAAFDEPNLVKIAWTLRVRPLGDRRSLLVTETRALATDAESRRRFRRYWSLLSPGIILIRWLALGPLKRSAERRAAALDRRAHAHA